MRKWSVAQKRKFKRTLGRKKLLDQVQVPEEIHEKHKSVIPTIIRRTTELLYSDGSTQVDIHTY